jgi:hypothetical protein
MKLTEEGLEGRGGSEVAMEVQPVRRAIDRGHKKDPNLDVSAGLAGERYTEKTEVSHANVIPNNDHVIQPGCQCHAFLPDLSQVVKGRKRVPPWHAVLEQKILNCVFLCPCHGIAPLD